MFFRGAFFYVCRAYLIRSLYKLSSNTTVESIVLASDSSPTTPSSPPSPSPARSGGSYFELGALPPPNVARPQPRTGVTGWGLGPTSVARTAFAVCFSESCALFLLVMCQAYDVMDARSVESTINFTRMFLLLHVFVYSLPRVACISDPATSTGDFRSLLLLP